VGRLRRHPCPPSEDTYRQVFELQTNAWEIQADCAGLAHDGPTRRGGATMCGFAAGLLRDPLDPKCLDRALESLHHRGPDSVRRWISPDRRWFLGHHRLSIIGLDHADP